MAAPVVTVGWFEIPVTDMDRAVAFYSTVFDCELYRIEMAGTHMAWFPWDETASGAGGSLVLSPDCKPSTEGTTVYFSCADLAVELDRVEKAGGKVLVPKTVITEDIGFFGAFLDTEGNRVALHSSP